MEDDYQAASIKVVNDENLSELGTIGLLIGNLAIDGYSARDLLSQALLGSNFLETVMNSCMASSAESQPDLFNQVECVLWALETLLS